MSLDRLGRAARIAIVLMAVALVACLVGPMMDDLDMTARLAILCFVALIATAILVPCARGAAARPGFALQRSSPPLLIPRRARPPDLLSLGVLLI